MIEINNLLEATDFLTKHEVVLLDLDDTLYSEKDYVKSGFSAIAQQYPTIPDMAEKLWRAFENGEQAIDFVLQSEGLYSAERMAACLQCYRSHTPSIHLYPQARTLLERLKDRGIRLGMITDGRPEGQRAKLLALGIEPYFEKILITDELGGSSFRKPNPAAFEEMHRFFNVAYTHIVYVGDNPAKDFIAPQRLGMSCVYFRNPLGLYFDSSQ